MNLLFVGFESDSVFGPSVSWRSIEGCEAVDFGSHTVRTLKLPAVWDSCFAPLETALGQSWDAVVCVADRDYDSIAVERVAINDADVSIKDSLGRRPRNKVILNGGDPGFWTGLPYRDLVLNLVSGRFPAVSSHAAGTGLANYVFYRLMNSVSQRGLRFPAGLIHFPKSGAVFSEEERKRFVSIVLNTLDPAGSKADCLGFDVDKMKARLGSEMSSER